MAIETGLRASELRSLTVSSFDLTMREIIVEASYSKHRREDVLPLREETVEELHELFRGIMPNVKAFGGRYKQLTDKISKMIKADLIVAGIEYIDESGRYADFYSLRHTTGSWLAAGGVHQKVAQSIMRHSDINLTMSRYTHVLRGQEVEAIKTMPNLSLPRNQKAAATGTDGKIDLASSLAFRSGKQRINMDFDGQKNENTVVYKSIEKASLSSLNSDFEAKNI